MPKVIYNRIQFTKFAVSLDADLHEQDPDYIHEFAEEFANVKTMAQARKVLDQHNNDGSWTVENTDRFGLFSDSLEEDLTRLAKALKTEFKARTVQRNFTNDLAVTGFKATNSVKHTTRLLRKACKAAGFRSQGKGLFPSAHLKTSQVYLVRHKKSYVEISLHGDVNVPSLLLVGSELS